jgi:PhoH-like ATPase
MQRVITTSVARDHRRIAPCRIFPMHRRKPFVFKGLRAPLARRSVGLRIDSHVASGVFNSRRKALLWRASAPLRAPAAHPEIAFKKFPKKICGRTPSGPQIRSFGRLERVHHSGPVIGNTLQRCVGHSLCQKGVAMTETRHTAGFNSSPLHEDQATRQRTRVVLDTSVLIGDPSSLTSFPGSEVVVPLTVVEELDGLKTRLDDVGRAARTALRTLEDLRRQAGGVLDTPLEVHAGAEGGSVHIEVNGIQRHLLVEHGLDPEIPDNRIIGAALGQVRSGPTRLISNDAALRIKAAHLGIPADEHQPVGRAASTRPMGWTSLPAPYQVIDDIYAAGAIPADAVEDGADQPENSFAVLRDGSHSALARRRLDEWVLLPNNASEAWGLRARSKEQRFALELLLDPEVTVVALDGRAGTGKTVMAIAAGLEQVVERRQYERLAVYRPLVPVGRAEVGFLPGGLDEKLDPWMSAIHDSIVALTDQRSSRDARRLIDDLIARGQLSLESVTFLRGRSLQRQFVVVDEAQNLEPTTLKTILTRVGEGTKVVFTGDTSQIDAPYMGESNNALAVLIQAFGGQECFGHVTLAACERSEVASLAAELL